MWKALSAAALVIGIIVVGVHSCSDRVPAAPVHLISSTGACCPDNTKTKFTLTSLLTGIFDAGRASATSKQITKKKTVAHFAKKKSHHHKSHLPHHHKSFAPSHVPANAGTSAPANPSHAPSTHSGLTGPPCCP